MSIKTRLDKLEVRQTRPEQNQIWLAWCDDDFATCGAETKTLKQLEAEGAKMISLTWGDE